MASTTKELKELSIEDLGRRAQELRENLFQDQLKLKTGTLDNPATRTGHRRELARVLTVITQKQGPKKKAKKPEQAA